MDKKTNVISKKIARLRGWIQAAATLLTNIPVSYTHLIHWLTTDIKENIVPVMEKKARKRNVPEQAEKI